MPGTASIRLALAIWGTAHLATACIAPSRYDPARCEEAEGGCIDPTETPTFTPAETPSGVPTSSPTITPTETPDVTQTDSPSTMEPVTPECDSTQESTPPSTGPIGCPSEVPVTTPFPSEVAKIELAAGGYGQFAGDSGSAHNLVRFEFDLAADAAEVYGWGSSEYGQLGTLEPSSYARPIEAFAGAITIAAGAHFSLAVVGPSTMRFLGVFCDGGQDCPNVDGTPQHCLFNSLNSSPIEVTIRGCGISTIAAGLGHALVLCDNGAVWGFGYGGSGELGDGLATSSALPVQAKFPPCQPGSCCSGSLPRITSVAAGNGISMALDSCGNVWTWGGHDGVATIGATPTPLEWGSGVSPVGIQQIAAGGERFLALGVDEAIYAWGNNYQLAVSPLGGTGDYYSSPVPIEEHWEDECGSSEAFRPKFDSISAAANEAVAVRKDGALLRWGSAQGATCEVVPPPKEKASWTAAKIAVSHYVGELQSDDAGTPGMVYSSKTDTVQAEYYCALGYDNGSGPTAVPYLPWP